jgi:hypothetical protein
MGINHQHKDAHLDHDLRARIVGPALRKSARWRMPRLNNTADKTAWIRIVRRVVQHIAVGV